MTDLKKIIDIVQSKMLPADAGIREDAPTNAVGTGSVAGIGIANPNPALPKQAEPGVKKKKRLKDFIAGARGIVSRVNV
jgi:hypothetical protein